MHIGHRMADAAPAGHSPIRVPNLSVCMGIFACLARASLWPLSMLLSV